MTNTGISAVNDLIAVTLDSACGYEEAAKDTKSAELKSLFVRHAQERRQIVQQLRQLVIAAGGTPQEDGTVLGSMHRSWTNLRASLSGSEQSIVNEVERGEDHIKAKFENALEDQTLGPQTRAVFESCFGSVKAGHDQISALKHRLAA